MIVSELQANPELDMIVYAFGGMLFGVPDAIERGRVSPSRRRRSRRPAVR